jgi:acetyl-CoA carboxylase carboxyltransferase component
MLDKAIGADFVFAWPTAQVTIVGAETAASVIFAREIKEADRPHEVQAQRIKEFSEMYENPYRAAEKGYVDDVIDPSDTRKVINSALDILGDKNKDNKAFLARTWRKYSNINL